MTKNLPSWMTQGEIPAPRSISSNPGPLQPEPIESPEDSPEGTAAPVEPTIDIVAGEDKLAKVKAFMVRDVKSWGRWMLILGVFHIIGNGFLDASWGVMLILVGIPSFFIQSSSLYVIYALTLLWAAFMNASSGWGGAAFAIIQVYFAWRVFRKYWAMRKFGLVQNERDQAYADTGPKPLVPRLFPWLGLVGGTLLLFSFIVIFMFAVIWGATHNETEGIPGMQIIVFSLTVVTSFVPVLMGVNLASLLGHYRPRFVAWLGLIFSTITLILFFVLMFSFS